jgi:hypothetical protein
MGSNDYTEVITDPIKTRQVLAAFERLVILGGTFKVLEFNPDTDRFAISCGRESNFPPFQDVECGGSIIDGRSVRKLWSNLQLADAVSFGNGLVGLLCESDRRSYMVVRDNCLQVARQHNLPEA